jgi:MHS family proline/betaine transporter-like MFS transporter
MPIYVRAHAGMSSAQSVWSNTFCTAVIVFLVPVVGWLSDRYGRRPFLAGSCALVFLLTAPLFWVIAALDSLPVVIAVQALFGVAIALYSGAAPAVVAELFHIHSRSRWSSVAYALAAALFGSFAPFIAVKLATQVGFLAPTAYVMAAALVSLLVVLRMPETGRKTFV